MRKSLLFIVIFSIVLLLFTDCRRSRSRGTKSRSRTSRHERTIPDKPKILPDNKQDTVYVLVPQEPDGTPNVKPDNNPNDDDVTIVVPTSKKLKPVVHSDNLPYPPKIVFKRSGFLPTPQEYIEHYNITGEMRELIIACDYNNKTVRNNSVALVATSPGEFNLGQVCDIFDFCFQNWSYVNDPISRDYYAKASETLRNGLNGDCDDFAILLCSAILAVGGEARISFTYDSSSGHAFTEVNIGTTDRRAVAKYLTARYGHSDLWHKEDGSGNWWLNLDWQASYPGGQYFKYNHGTMFNIIQNIYQNL
jgi:hypothetical protein